VYATELDAVKDAVRFRLWAELGCVDLKAGLGVMKLNHTDAHAAFVKPKGAWKGKRENFSK
jgi:hypothetical protein